MKKRITRICLLVYSFMFVCLNSVHALEWGTLYSGFLPQYGDGKILSAATYIAGWIRYAAIAIAVGMLMYKGIQFILSSPEGKAEVKKQMIPWAIGLVLLFTFNIFLNIIAGIAQDFSMNFSNPDKI